MARADGVQAVSPRSRAPSLWSRPAPFYDEIGRYGVENQHYVGDVGAFVLAFGVAVLTAARHPSWRVPVLALGALWYGFHAINHAFDVGEARSDARGIFDALYIGLGGALLRLPGLGGDRLQAPGAASPDREEDAQ